MSSTTAAKSSAAAKGAAPKKPAKRRKLAQRWTCDGCGVSVARIDGGKLELPESWTSDRDGTLCLLCRRERAAEEAIASAPDSGLAERAQLRRSALIEFEVRRRPGHGDGEIARTCRSSVAAVAAARRRLKIPKPAG